MEKYKGIISFHSEYLKNPDKEIFVIHEVLILVSGIHLTAWAGLTPAPEAGALCLFFGREFRKNAALSNMKIFSIYFVSMVTGSPVT